MYTIEVALIEQQVLEFMHSLGCEPAGNAPLVFDGKIHRYSVEDDKLSQKSGAYCIFTDNWPAGWVKNWRTGICETWRFKGNGHEPKDFFKSEEYKEMCRRSDEHQKQLRAELKKRQEAAILEARKKWGECIDAAGEHPYIKRKKIQTHGVKRTFNVNAYMSGWGGEEAKQGELAIPLRNIDGDIQSLQFIYPDGTKRFFTDAPVKGAFFSICLEQDYFQKYCPDAPILIAEGYATAATIYECTGIPTVAAMNAGNLLPVAEAIKKKYPDRKIIIMADNDRHENGYNTGVEKAQEAVKKLGLQGMIYPEFAPNEEGSDWNDYAAIHGTRATMRILQKEILLESRSQRIKDISEHVELVNAQDLLKTDFPPVKWAVEGFLPSGLTILGGGPKVGKSILALHLSIGVSIGGCVLGKIDVEQGDVLYLALEDNKRRLQERIRSSNILPEDCDVSRLDLITTIPRQHEGGLEFVAWWLDNHPQARLVIIDTLQKFRKQLSGKGGVYGEDYDAVSEIKAIADKYDVAFLVIHHLKKVSAKEENLGDWINQFSGSAGLSGSADTLFVLKRGRTDKYGMLYRTGRDVEEKNFRMYLDGFGWVLEGEAAEFTMPTWKKQILDYLKEHGSVTPMELAGALNLNDNTARTKLRRLVQEGSITKTGYGMYVLKQE